MFRDFIEGIAGVTPSYGGIELPPYVQVYTKAGALIGLMKVAWPSGRDELPVFSVAADLGDGTMRRIDFDKVVYQRNMYRGRATHIERWWALRLRDDEDLRWLRLVKAFR